METNDALFPFFRTLIERYVQRAAYRGPKGRGCCPIHQGDNPQAFSFDLERGVWTCHAGCGGGGIVDLARKLGEPLPHRGEPPKPLAVVSQARKELARFVSREFSDWKEEKRYAVVSAILQAHSAIAMLLRLERLFLSDAEWRTVSQAIGEQYDAIEELTPDLDRYNANPLAPEAEAKREFLAEPWVEL